VGDKVQVVVVTGASAGVGRAVARSFARNGARIGLLARGRSGLDGARRDVQSLGGTGLAIPTDVSDAAQVERAAEAVEHEFGPIDVWVNDAMCSVFSPAKQMTPEDYRRVTEVTYLGYVNGTLAALKRMLPRDRGVIVQIGSALAYRAIPLQSAYCAAKHAVRGFTDSVRCELIHDGSNVRITMVQMPALNTPQFDWVKSRLPRKPQPVPPIYQPEVAADAVVHATRHYRREWYVGASTAIVIAGNKMAPGLGDWYLGRQGYDSQQYDGAVSSHRRNNLDQPVDDNRDYGAHGDFDVRAVSHSYHLWLNQRRQWLLLAGAAGAVCDAVCNGPSRVWRGGLIGLGLGALAAVAAGARSQSDRNALQAERRVPPHPHAGPTERTLEAVETVS
jgi:NAD(P)-dependent dehydrogenase (short-subunit alcohol dehydrogenase family)